jgi:hypothetical protein
MNHRRMGNAPPQVLVAPSTPLRSTLVVGRNATHPVVPIPALGGTPSLQQQVTRCERLSPQCHELVFLT